jgi:hypothetical protein
MILRLAEALDIPLRERNLMLLTAGYAPAYGETQLADPHLAPVRAALERVLEGHLPYPAVLVDRHGDLVSGNSAFDTLVAGGEVARELLEPRINVPRLLLHPRGLAPRIANLDVWAWHIIDALQHEKARNPADRLDALADELVSFVPARRHPPGLDYIGCAVPLRLQTPEGELQLLSTLTYFGTAVDVTVDELKLEAFLPADEATANILAVWAQGAGVAHDQQRPAPTDRL